MPKRTCSPRTVRKALVVLTGMVKSEQVYWPSSDRLTSPILMVSSCDEARTSSILWSLRAAKGKTTQRITERTEKKDRNTNGQIQWRQLAWRSTICNSDDLYQNKGECIVLSDIPNSCQMPQTHTAVNGLKHFLYICILGWQSYSQSVRIQKASAGRTEA